MVRFKPVALAVAVVAAIMVAGCGSSPTATKDARVDTPSQAVDWMVQHDPRIVPKFCNVVNDVGVQLAATNFRTAYVQGAYGSSGQAPPADPVFMELLSRCASR